MKSRTLRHLLLLSGKSIASETTDSVLKSQILEVCESLRIERERRSPYELTYRINGSEKSLTIEDDRFTFHVRGDVPGRLHLTQHRDIRKENWAEAFNVWREFLGTQYLGNENNIAPVHQLIPDHSKTVILLRVMLLLIGCAVSIISDPKTAFAILPLLVYLTTTSIWSKLKYSELILSVVVLALLSQQNAARILVVYLTIESAVSFFTSKRLRMFVTGGTGLLVIALRLDVVRHFESPSFGRVLISAALVSIAVASFPRGIAGDLSRTSIPLAIACAVLAVGLPTSAVLGALLVGIAPLINWQSQQNPSTSPSGDAVPVAVRKR